jgi:hypothetical protein
VLEPFKAPNHASRVNRKFFVGFPHPRLFNK